MISEKKALISLSRLSAGYGERTVLREITLEVREGEFLGIAGANGSGKSTLLRVMTGLTAPSAGEIMFSGIPAARISRQNLARRFGTVFLHRESLPSFTAEEYIRQRLFSRGELASAEANRIITETMETAGVAALAQQNIRTLSAGQMQLVSIAGALAQNDDFLFLDEPTSHLDIAHTLETAGLLASLHRRGTTIIAVFHDINMALELCTRIAGIRDGRIVCDLSPEKFTEENAADRLFDVRSVTETDPFTGKKHLHFTRSVGHAGGSSPA
jgi:iron complex transport system ATP-binding protein